MDYFDGITTEDFVTYFLKDLNCLDELIEYVYPNEMAEEIIEDNYANIIANHLRRCESILYTHIQDVLMSNYELSKEEINDLFNQKKNELKPILFPLMKEYADNVKVNYIFLGSDENDVDIEDEVQIEDEVED